MLSGPATLAGNLVTLTGPGTVLLTASQPASGSYAAATAQTSFSVSPAIPTLSFNLTPNGSVSGTLANGSTGKFSLMVTSPAGVRGQVSLTCSGAPSWMGCAVNPSSVGLGQPSPVTVSLSPRLPHNLEASSRGVDNLRGIEFALLPLVGCIARRKRLAKLCGRRLPWLCTFIAFACIAVGLSGCGSNVGQALTQPGQFSILVTGSAAGVTHTVALTVIIEP